MEATRSVTAHPIFAQQQIDGTFVDVCANLAAGINLVARIADTTISAFKIFTRSVWADVFVHGTFVNV